MTFRKGQKISKKTREKMSEAKKGKKHWRWKGSKVKYSGLHGWVKRELGNAKECSVCKIKGEYHSHIRKGTKVKAWSIQWANISGRYKRDLTDWINLCQLCHKHYEKNI